jgi:tetratricopeptide (TPR) repeat protein
VESAFSSADLHLWLLAMRRRWPDDKEARKALVRDHLAEALREDPLSATLIGWNTGDDFKPPSVEDLRGLAKQRSSDWRSWLVLASYSPDPAEKEASLRKAVVLNDSNAQAQNRLAWLLVTSGRATEALPFANRALDLAPWEPNIVDTLAEVAVQLGKCPEALQLERRAVRMAGSEGKQDDIVRNRLGEVEKRCAGK